MELDLKPEDINKFLVESILKSKLGESLKTAIDVEVKNLSSTYNNPFKAAISRHIEEQITVLLRTTFKPQLDKILKEKIAEQFTDEILERIVSAGIERIRRNY